MMAYQKWRSFALYICSRHAMGMNFEIIKFFFLERNEHKSYVAQIIIFCSSKIWKWESQQRSKDTFTRTELIIVAQPPYNIRDSNLETWPRRSQINTHAKKIEKRESERENEHMEEKSASVPIQMCSKLLEKSATIGNC